MGLIDYLLNLASLLLWLNWRGTTFDPLAGATPATLVGTLRRAEPARAKRWYFLAALAGLLGLRAWLDWQLGPALNWTARVNLFATRLAFKSDFLGLMLLYSVLSFGLLLGICLSWLLLLSLLDTGAGAALPIRLARQHLGFIDGWPAWRKFLLPLVVGFGLWWLLTWPLCRWGLIPQPASATGRLAQSGLVGFSAYLAWRDLIAALLGLHLLHNYLYFGRHPLWSFVDGAAGRLLRPLRALPLRWGKFDVSPVVGLALVLVLARLAEAGLAQLYLRLSR